MGFLPIFRVPGRSVLTFLKALHCKQADYLLCQENRLRVEYLGNGSVLTHILTCGRKIRGGDNGADDDSG